MFDLMMQAGYAVFRLRIGVLIVRGSKIKKYRLKNLMFGNKIKLEEYEKNNTSHIEEGGVNMATSSITKNFIISGQKQVGCLPMLLKYLPTTEHRVYRLM